MSDFPEGTDWWKATDGRWYPAPATDDRRPPGDDTPVPDVLKPSNENKLAVGLILAVLLIGLVVVGVTSGGDDDDDGQVSRTAEEADAYRACKEFVTGRLRAPATASFPDYYDRDREVRVHVAGNGYRIVSHVDSENGFGALVRTGWICQVSDGGDVWRLVDLQMLE